MLVKKKRVVGMEAEAEEGYDVVGFRGGEGVEEGGEDSEREGEREEEEDREG